MNRTEPIEAVSFDAAGTLLFPHPSVGEIYAEIMAKHGLPLRPTELEAEFRRSFVEARKDPAIADSEEREYRYWKDIVAASIDALATRPENFDRLFEDLWTEFAKGSRWRLDVDTLALFDCLDELQIPFILLTNWDRRVYQVLSDHNILHRFAKIFVSSELGCDKPDPSLFDRVATTIGIQPRRILHLGDRLDTDVQGALDAGFQAAWIDASPAPAPPGARKLSRVGDLRSLFA